MRPCWRLLALLLVGWSVHPDTTSAQSSFTGVVRLRGTVNARQDTIVQTTKGYRSRLDYLCDLVRSCTMIGDAGAHTMVIIEHDRKVFVTVTQADSWQLEAMMRTLRTGGRAMSGLWDVSGFRFKRTRKTGQVAGQRCELWAGHAPGAPRDEVSEVCLGATGGIAVGLLAGVFNSETTVPPEYDESGLPRKALNAGILRLRLVKNGSPTTVEVISIEPGTVDDSLFEVPAGYEGVRMATVIRWMQAAVQAAQHGELSLTPRPGDSLSYPLPDDPGLSQPPSLISCAWDSLAPGDYRGEGEVTYRVTPHGVPDTATITVQRLYGAELSTFRAAAQHVLALCRFTPVMADTNVPPVLMRQRIAFARAEGQSNSRDREEYVPEEIPPADMQPVTIVTCDPNLHEEGVIRVRMVVGKDGLPEPGTISAVNETRHTAVGEAAVAFAQCVFTPARYKGVPVRQKIEFTVTLRYDP
jgi:hypothetical protein